MTTRTTTPAALARRAADYAERSLSRAAESGSAWTADVTAGDYAAAVLASAYGSRVANHARATETERGIRATESHSERALTASRAACRALADAIADGRADAETLRSASHYAVSTAPAWLGVPFALSVRGSDADALAAALRYRLAVSLSPRVDALADDAERAETPALARDAATRAERLAGAIVGALGMDDGASERARLGSDRAERAARLAGEPSDDAEHADALAPETIGAALGRVVAAAALRALGESESRADADALDSYADAVSERLPALGWQWPSHSTPILWTPAVGSLDAVTAADIADGAPRGVLGVLCRAATGHLDDGSAYSADDGTAYAVAVANYAVATEYASGRVIVALLDDDGSVLFADDSPTRRGIISAARRYLAPFVARSLATRTLAEQGPGETLALLALDSLERERDYRSPLSVLGESATITEPEPRYSEPEHALADAESRLADALDAGDMDAERVARFRVRTAREWLARRQSRDGGSAPLPVVGVSAGAALGVLALALIAPESAALAVVLAVLSLTATGAAVVLGVAERRRATDAVLRSLDDSDEWNAWNGREPVDGESEWWRGAGALAPLDDDADALAWRR